MALILMRGKDITRSVRVAEYAVTDLHCAGDGECREMEVMDAPDWIPSGATRAAYCLMQNAAVPRLPDPVLIMHGFHDRCSRGGERDGDLFEAAVKRIREETGDYSRPAWLLVYESPLDGGYPGAWMNSWR